MYKNILIPMDGSQEAERVILRIQPELADDSQIILLMVIHPLPAQRIGELVVTASEMEDAQLNKARVYFRRVIQDLGGSRGHWRGEAVVASSVPEGISKFAAQENVDLIAMYTHNRKGLAKLIRGSVADKVKEISTVEVKAFSERELVASSARC